MRFKDYYRILGLATDATAEDIKTAYRKLARTYHPDVNKAPGAEKRFTEIGEAHEALEDPQRRAAYDRLRAGGWQDGQEMDAPQPARGAQRRGGFDDGQADRFSDFFQSMFSGHPHAGGRPFHVRGSDIHHALAVSLEESYGGGERELKFHTPRYDGQAESTAEARSISVKIPKGVAQGTRIRLRGQGQPGSDAQSSGDLYLDVELAAHPLYRVDGHDLSLEVPVAPWEAVLGAQIAVPTLGGTVTATIPAGSQNGQKLRLKGRGLPGDPLGDQYLVLSLAVPPACSERCKALYQELAKESAFDPRAHLAR